jgi:hypothetical protein
MLDSINLQMTLGQSKYGFRRISFIIKMVDYYTTHTDFRTTHVRCPRARVAGCSFQTHIRLAGFTVQQWLYLHRGCLVCGGLMRAGGWPVVAYYGVMARGSYTGEGGQT